MLRAHATSRILDSLLRNVRSRVPFRQPTTAAPWLYFGRHGSPDSSVPPPGDANGGPSHDAVASCSLFDHPEILDYVQAARAISAALETIWLSGSRPPGPESRMFHQPIALPVAGRRRSEIQYLTDSALRKERVHSPVVHISLRGPSLDPESPEGTAPRILISRRQERFPSEIDSSADT